MYRLFQYFTDLVLLRARPQDLPPSSALLWLLSWLYVLLETVHMAGVFETPWEDFAISLLDLVLLLGASWLLLAATRHGARWLQTATALVGGGIVILLVAIPLSLAMGESGVGQLAMLLYWVLIVWNQIFLGHVLRHALDVSLLVGIGFGLLYSILSGLILQGVFGPPATAGMGG